MGNHQEAFTKAVIRNFSKLIKDARHSFCSKVEGVQLLLKIFGAKLDETGFQIWLAEVLRVKDRDELLTVMEYSEEDKTTFTPWGWKFLRICERESAYSFWKVNSEISVHRSNDWHLTNISKENLSNQVADIHDVDTTTVDTKRGPKLQAHRRVTTNSYKKLHQDFQKLYNSNMSYRSFINLKPFYISQPTEKETEMYVCNKCLNPHCLYQAIRSALTSVIDLPTSLSQYLCKNMNCGRETETDFYKRTCILGQCDNCKIVNISDDLKNYLLNVQAKNVHCDVFETVETRYYNKSGKLVSYMRTVWVDKHDSIKTIINKLQVLAEKYLLHRFFVVNDKVYWKKFLQATQYYTLWLDCSQNIAFTEKKQVQSAHVSGRQHRLHNTVIQSPNDNCQKQYKCTFTFFQMKKIAAEFGVTVV